MKKTFLVLSIFFMFSCKKDDTLKPRSVVTVNTPKTAAIGDLQTYNTRGIARVTGKTLPWDKYPNPNQTDVNYNVGGTDLGIMWDLGGKQTGIIFGDTFGSDWVYTDAGGASGTNWRSNVVAWSKDTNLDDGLSFEGMITDNSGSAIEVIPSPHNTSGNGSFTSIPTAAVRLGNVDYIHYMDIRQWGTAGNWTTNSSSLYMTADNGKTWSAAPGVRFSSTSNFAQAAYAKKDGYVYMIGTRSGRFGAAYLSRFLDANILQQSEYEYWNGTTWVKNNEAAAVKIFDAPVGEISVVYNTHFNRWITTYLTDWPYGIVMRSAVNITGPWTKTRTVVSALTQPGLYGAYIHPQKNSGDELYFLMSVWQPYNVFLVKSKLRIQ
ncbi:DUF4185 domain-containing protein [Mucilaginibacter hurinus]|uniref:DUF4185 domain-containing protein n=1 Tax=Mucilaginibacter hurinus TaxID=2201324 RepID=A0A367GRL8_9SPHI|nr:DUF4185 domain-containing protein [Mucilaginibacter hurinus]RCH56112.1 DUF4185 domain-containing protein [Mucilaginibacter hurinus]